ncbi:right-handed parallel beta-helix repeat-containing protein, partial [Patescibacteria group bacterium]|nr:right-handed parallel beta-helix repeat-containing protein [Patescibacteria group bacterium]
SHNQKYIDLDGNESSLVPQFIIEHNLIEDNFHLPIYLADLDQFGTRITNNIFRGGALPYITIKDSDRPYVVISQNYFEDQGIFIENSNHIILWANKFNSIQDYAVQAINSNLIAFQYNIFSDIGDTAIFTKNTPQIELVHNTFGEVGERIVRK